MMQGGVDIEQLPVFQIQQIGQPVGLFGGQFFDRGLLLVILGPEDKKQPSVEELMMTVRVRFISKLN